MHQEKGKAKTVSQLIHSRSLPATYERFMRLRYGLSLDPQASLEQIEMPEKTARVVHGLEAMLLERLRSPKGPGSLKKELLIRKLKKSQEDG